MTAYLTEKFIRCSIFVTRRLRAAARRGGYRLPTGQFEVVVTMRSLLIVASIITVVLWTPITAVAASPALLPQSASVNRGVVEIETTGESGSSARVAEDLVSIVNDGATRRLLPVVGQGALQIITDLRLLRGIDMAILPIDALEYARDQKIFPGIDTWITYVAKLNNEEFHLLARPEIKTIEDLANKRVNVDLPGSGTAITSSRLFALIGLPITVTNDSQNLAMEKLLSGEIAAIAFVTAKPAPLFRTPTMTAGLHFLAIPQNADVMARYAPTRLTPADYPGLVPEDQPVQTVAIDTVLVAADLQQVPDRYRNVANVVEAFFTGFPTLLAPGHHPKWKEVNLSAELPGWQRYLPAADWLQRNSYVAASPNREDMQAIFARYIDERLRAAHGTPMTEAEKNDLFKQFQRWENNSTR
jgi:TRAP-type uncharacterized transport system substrate-binding protein